MKRAISVWLPTFPIDLVLRRERRNGGSPEQTEHPGHRIILLATAAARGQIVACCPPEALRLGVRPGLTVSQAVAALTGARVRVEPFTPERDAARLRALAAWAHRFSPAVASDEPDGLLMDVSGCHHLFGGEYGLVAKIRNDLRTLGFRSRVATASTFACAWATARYGGDDCAVVPAGSERRTLAALPTAALNIGADVQLALAEVGIERIEHLLGLPRSVLPARFGHDLLLRLAQALGEAIETIDPIRPVEPPRVEQIFDGPTTQVEAIELAVRQLVGELTDRLRVLESGCRCIEVRLIRPGATPIDLRVSLGRPSRNAKHLWSLLRPKLERVNLGFGVEEIVLVATRTARLAHEQLETWRDPDGVDPVTIESSCGELIETLSNQLGPERVRAAEVVESHIPERAFRSFPAAEVADFRGTNSNSSPTSPRTSHHPPAAAGPRPSFLFDRPEPVQVMALTPDGPVLSVTWNGDEQRAAASVGPERIGAAWWQSPDQRVSILATRDYFRVQDGRGRWLWVFRELETGRWFVHGLWT